MFGDVGAHIGMFFIKLFVFIIFLILLYFISKILSKIITSRIAAKTILEENSKYEKSTIGFLENTFFVLVMILGIYLTFLMLGIDLDLFFVPVAIGVGFALEEVIQNILGGALFLNMKDVKVGDTIQIRLDKKRNYFGKIVEVNTRHTIMQLAQGRKVLLPNSLFITTPIKTFSTEDLIRQEIKFTLNSNTDFEKTKSLCIDTVNQFKFVVEKDSTRLDFEAMDAKGMYVILTYYTVPKGGLVNRNKVRRKLKEVFQKNGIFVAMPRQILTLDKSVQNFDRLVR